MLHVIAGVNMCSSDCRSCCCRARESPTRITTISTQERSLGRHSKYHNFKVKPPRKLYFPRKTWATKTPTTGTHAVVWSQTYVQYQCCLTTCNAYILEDCNYHSHRSAEMGVKSDGEGQRLSLMDRITFKWMGKVSTRVLTIFILCNDPSHCHQRCETATLLISYRHLASKYGLHFHTVNASTNTCIMIYYCCLKQHFSLWSWHSLFKCFMSIEFDTLLASCVFLVPHLVLGTLKMMCFWNMPEILGFWHKVALWKFPTPSAGRWCSSSRYLERWWPVHATRGQVWAGLPRVQQELARGGGTS